MNLPAEGVRIGGDAASAAQPTWDLFIAHATPDAARARELYRCLTPSLKPFLALECLQGGDVWDREIATAQRSSRATAILVSLSATEAMYAREEASVAVALHKFTQGAHRVIPVYLDGFLNVAQNTIYGIFNFQSLDAARDGGIPGVARKLIELLKDGNRLPAPAGPPAAAPAHPLLAFPPGPAIEPYRVGKVLIQAFADTIRPEQAALTLDEAVAMRVESEPGNPELRYLHHSEVSPPRSTPPLIYWTEVFQNACLYGPRMVAALLLVVDPLLLPPRAREARSNLLNQLKVT